MAWRSTLPASLCYVADTRSDNVSAYTIDAISGVLKKVKGSPFAAGATPVYVTVDPTGKFAYVPNVGSNDISAYTINTTDGALTPVTGSPFKAGAEAYSLAVGLRASSPMSPTMAPTRLRPMPSTRLAAR